MNRSRSFRRHQAQRSRARVARRLKGFGQTDTSSKRIGKLAKSHGQDRSRGCHLEAKEIKRLDRRAERRQAREIERDERH